MIVQMTTDDCKCVYPSVRHLWHWYCVWAYLAMDVGQSTLVRLKYLDNYEMDCHDFILQMFTWTSMTLVTSSLFLSCHHELTFVVLSDRHWGSLGISLLSKIAPSSFILTCLVLWFMTTYIENYIPIKPQLYFVFSARQWGCGHEQQVNSYWRIPTVTCTPSSRLVVLTCSTQCNSNISNMVGWISQSNDHQAK